MTMEYWTIEQLAYLPPVPPEGKGWSLGGVVPSPKPGGSSVYMYWQRPKVSTSRECRKCRAVAFANGKCIGCGTTLDN